VNAVAAKDMPESLAHARPAIFLSLFTACATAWFVARIPE